MLPTSKISVKIIPVIFVLLLAAGCFSTKKADILPSENKDYVYSVAEIYKSAKLMAQKSIMVQGRFVGWDGCSGKTKLLTRSDWTLSGDKSCVLVTGSFPRGLNPRNKKDLGKTVVINAVVIYQDGFLTLKNVSR